ncbi:MAG: DinB family protein [Actinomycetota bacterium]
MSTDRQFAELQPLSERVGLTERLDEERRAVIAQAADLTSEELHARPLAATNLSIGRLVKHLAFAEDRWFQHKLLGLELGDPWCSVDTGEVREWSFYSADADSADEVLGLYRAACERSRSATAATPSMGTCAALVSFDKKPVNLRWLLAHMIDETARHSGHADLIRDALGRPSVR